MKRVLFFIFVISAFSNSFAQDLSEGFQAKNSGNEAYRNKEYVEAIKQWEIYLNSGEEEVADDANTLTLYTNSFRFAANDFMQNKDFESAFKYYEKYFELVPEEKTTNGRSVYEMAFCAAQIEKNDEALNLYQTAVELDHRADAAMLRIADIYRKAGDDEKMTAVLKEALDKYPQSRERSKMISMITTPLLREAAVPFNAANELAKNASGGDPTEYVANMSVAVKKFEDAIPLFEEILKLDPQNNQANTYINACRDNINAFNTYKSSLNN
jgi:tetratricopeptide (TPR) repeat protein